MFLRKGVEALRELADSASVRPAALNVPVLIGGAAPAAIRRAGELGDGWIMSPFGDLEDFERGRMLAREGAEAAERDPDALIYGRLLYVRSRRQQRPQPRTELTTFLHGYYGDWFDVDQHAIFGPASEVAERLAEHQAAGIAHLMLGVPTLDPEHLRRLSRGAPATPRS